MNIAHEASRGNLSLDPVVMRQTVGHDDRVHIQCGAHALRGGIGEQQACGGTADEYHAGAQPSPKARATARRPGR
ncbi:MAG: hypothetical protein M3Q42_14355 [Pseudomonadota bacterium]|nr:hypothetical protein [Pseudomonadota bacterium]